MNKEELIKKAMEIDGLMSATELGILYDLVRENSKRNNVVCETGTFKGRSTMVIAGALTDKNSMVKSFDSYGFGGEIRGEYLGHSLKLAKYNLVDFPNVKLVQGRFIDLLSEVPDCDMAFLDGDHTYYGMLVELLYFSAHTSVIAGHDWHDQRVRDAVNKFLLAHPEYTIENFNTEQGMWKISLK